MAFRLTQGTTQCGLGDQRDRGDNLNNINPDDIENMTVLKGSTAAALYGQGLQLVRSSLPLSPVKKTRGSELISLPAILLWKL